MRLLVIGGTVFVGRAVVEAALARGDAVTLFHRGWHGRDLFDGVETILGDRTTDLDRLGGREWDLVVDTCGFRPEHVAASARALAGAVDRYAFVSTAGVYRDWPERPVPDERAPLHEGDDEDYSVLKAACERALEAELPGRAVQVRPGIIVGPHENIGRLPHWLRRMERGGDVLAPGRAEAEVQLIDARDLAAWTLAMGARQDAGAFNAVAPPGWTTWGELLETCRAAVNPAATLRWVDGERVAAALEDPWTQLPLWPAPAPDAAGVYGMDTRRAVAAGLVIRSLEATVADTWAWLRDGGRLSEWRDDLRGEGLDAARERALLDELS
jgi:2'-hydroxyisoflavone reductase